MDNTEFLLGEIKANLKHMNASLEDIKEMNARLHKVEGDLKLLSTKLVDCAEAVHSSRVPVRVHVATWSGIMGLIVGTTAALKLLLGL